MAEGDTIEDMVAKRARPSLPATADPQQVLVAVTTTPGLEDVITEEIHTTLSGSDIVRVYAGLGRLHLVVRMDDGQNVPWVCYIKFVFCPDSANLRTGAGAVERAHTAPAVAKHEQLVRPLWRESAGRRRRLLAGAAGDVDSHVGVGASVQVHVHPLSLPQVDSVTYQ